MTRARRRVIPLWVRACVLASLASAAARAQAGDPVAVSAEKLPDLPLNAGAAENAYREAMTAYRAGDVQSAFVAMRQSYVLSRREELLFNIARLERELQRCPAAHADYQAYLARLPNGKYRSNAEQASGELASQCAIREPAPAVQLAPPPKTEMQLPADPLAPAPPYWTNERKLGWALISAGTLAVGGTIYFTFAERSAGHEAAESIARQQAGGPHWDQSLQSRQDRDKTAAWVLGAASGAFLAGGTLALLLTPHGSERNASATLSLQPGLVRAGYAFRF